MGQPLEDEERVAPVLAEPRGRRGDDGPQLGVAATQEGGLDEAQHPQHAVLADVRDESLDDVADEEVDALQLSLPRQDGGEVEPGEGGVIEPLLPDEGLAGRVD